MLEPMGRYVCSSSGRESPRFVPAAPQAAALRYGEMVITVFTQPPGFHVRTCFDGMGFAPEDFDLVVIKTPHAQVRRRTVLRASESQQWLREIIR